MDGSVSIFIEFIHGQLKETRKFEGEKTLVQFINDDIVMASSDGKLRILNENLEIKKQLNAGTVTQNSTPYCLTGNEKYLAVSGNYDGVVRYYRRNGDAEPEKV